MDFIYQNILLIALVVVSGVALILPMLMGSGATDVNPAAATHYLQQDFESITAHDYLSSVAPFSEGEHVVEALQPPKKIADELSMLKNEPCLVIQRRTWSGGNVVTFVRLWFPASRYRLVGRFFA